MNIFKTTLLMAILMSGLSVYSQSIQALDDKNGFSVFTFSKSLKELKKSADLKRTSSNRSTSEEIYTVKNIGDFPVYEYPVQSIDLFFYKEQLYQISVRVSDRYDMIKNSAIRMEIFRKVTKTYGYPAQRDTTYETRSIRQAWLSYWYGNNVTLIQSWPQDGAATRPTQDFQHPFVFTGDTWHFINNRIAIQRRQELGLDKGL